MVLTICLILRVQVLRVPIPRVQILRVQMRTKNTRHLTFIYNGAKLKLKTKESHKNETIKSRTDYL